MSFATCWGIVAAGVLAAGARGQSFNVDVGDNTAPHGLPSASYGAAAGVAGTWNAVDPFVGGPQALVDVNGMSTGVTMQLTSGTPGTFAFDNAFTTGDDDALLDDVQDVGFAPSSVAWTISGLVPGNYLLYTYAWAPDSASYVSTVNGATQVGGAFLGTLAVGLTHALDAVTVGPAGTLVVVVTATTQYGSLNGLQVVRADPLVVPSCFGDGTGAACPCANSGAAGQGCANGVDPNGALLAANGVPSLSSDTLVLSGSGMPASPGLYFQGTVKLGGGSGIVFGDGLRCVGGTVIRLGVVQAPSGSSSFPSGTVAPNNTPIGVRGLVAPGNAREYQLWYRDSSAFCTPSGFNLTNAVSVVWAP